MYMFIDLLKASTRPIVVVMLAFAFIWTVLEGLLDPKALEVIFISVISFLFGEKVAKK